MKTKLSFAIGIVLALLFIAGAVPTAFADAHCFCKISCTNLSGQTSATNVIKDLSPLFTYKGINPQKEDNQRDCNKLCTAAAAGYIHSQAIASAACAMGCPNGSHVSAFSAVGTAAYRAVAPEIGVLKNTPAVISTTYDCNGMPGTWLDKPTSGNGGHARCVKNSCNAIGGVPIAPSWFSIGTAWSSATGPAWVTDGSGNIWYGVPAHATTTIVNPAECRWQ